MYVRSCIMQYIEYINRQKSWLRVRYSDECDNVSARGKVEGWWVSQFFASFDVACKDVRTSAISHGRSKRPHQSLHTRWRLEP